MLYNLARPFAEHFALFNLFRYITFRSGAACLTALFLSLWLGPRVIARLRQVQRGGQPIRALGPERHILEKAGTPTMGGVLILMSLFVLDAAVGRPVEPLRLGGDGDHRGLRGGRLRGRLPQAVAPQHRGREQAHAARLRVRGLARRRLVAEQPDAGAAREQRGVPVRQGIAAAAGLCISAVRHAGHHRLRQRGELHRRAGRAGHRAGGDRRPGVRADLLSCRQPHLRRLPASSTPFPGQASSVCSAPR